MRMTSDMMGVNDVRHTNQGQKVSIEFKIIGWNGSKEIRTCTKGKKTKSRKISCWLGKALTKFNALNFVQHEIWHCLKFNG